MSTPSTRPEIIIFDSDSMTDMGVEGIEHVPATGSLLMLWSERGQAWKLRSGLYNVGEVTYCWRKRKDGTVCEEIHILVEPEALGHMDFPDECFERD